jgi:hypothetical protein
VCLVERWLLALVCLPAGCWLLLVLLLVVSPSKVQQAVQQGSSFVLFDFNLSNLTRIHKQKTIKQKTKTTNFGFEIHPKTNIPCPV